VAARPIRRLLIANRGEIAVRIIRACREMDISPVAVCSEADRDALHASLADRVLCVGPAPAAESYLSTDRLLRAAAESGADAVHPGYGFLSESAEFARACREAGLIWVGPPPEAMELLGDKIGAKRLMESAGVPTVPGCSGDDQSDAGLRAEAERIGTPLLVKAAGGGGGRGMRRVDSLDALQAALDAARQEARAAFGDPRLLLERFIQRPRHVEIQILGDQHGGLVHLFERDCSLQRRHQKLVEESPAPSLPDPLRRQMTATAVAAARAAGYWNAGTVEFLVEEPPGKEPRFHFLEVNARLQVEHPVTELVTGLDLVKLQLRVAAGEALPFTQEDVVPRGHAIEARIYAEDPAVAFRPSTGRLLHWSEPSGPGVRVDSGVRRGDEVSAYYDPLLAKLVAYGGNREEALARLDRALGEFHALPLRTDIGFLREVCRSAAFREGRVDVEFLEREFATWRPPSEPPEEVILALAAEAATRASARRPDAPRAGDSWTPWADASGWRAAGP